jgi:hypothetical protein
MRRTYFRRLVLMNDPEVMERIMDALEKIAYWIEIQVDRK